MGVAGNTGNVGQAGTAGDYWLCIRDVQGSYTIPYIHSGRDLRVKIDFASLPADAARATVTLCWDGKAWQQDVDRANPVTDFVALRPGEYGLTAEAADQAGECVWRASHRSLGVGTVVAALGDSLTEGYLGHGFARDDLDLKAAHFPPNAVSDDSRNFPQFSPTTAHHRPDVNCFQSWMTRLNDGLTNTWQQPVFIANEGWGGYTAENYLTMMRTNQDGWVDRMRLLQPTVWLIHLGVNDERAAVSADAFAANLRDIVDLLCADFGAEADAIYVARPSYDYAPGASAILRGYITQIDRLVAELGLWPGPDFFATFATDKERWYGPDPVHPGPEGMDLMADLWLAALAPNRPRAKDSMAGVVRLPQDRSPEPC